MTLNNKSNHINWRKTEFKIGAQHLEQIPYTEYPEVAFVGRSNVGKSSLINALTNNNSLSRTSKNPGCTKQLNFFLIGDTIMLTDMPGYGFAKVSKKEKEHWQNLIRGYLLGRKQLKRIFLLIDARHGYKSSDIEIMKMLDESGVVYQITFTKTDKAEKKFLNKLSDEFSEFSLKHAAMHPEFIFTSSHEKKGIEQLTAIIESC